MIAIGRIEVRPARESDMPAILAIINDAIVNTTAVWSLVPTSIEQRLAWWRERVGAGMPVLVAVDESRVLGFASYAQFRPWEGYLHTVEHSIYVDAGARGHGVGAALLRGLIDCAEAAGKHVMVGGIEATNTPSIRLHARFGFTEAGRLAEVGRKFDRWLDLLFMQKLISER